MPVSRCTNCNEYETTKTSNFKRHVERCRQNHKRIDVAPDAPQTRHSDLATRESEPAIHEPRGRVAELSNGITRPAKRAIQLTDFDAMNEQQSSSSDESEENWLPETSASARRPYESRDRDPTMVSTPLMKQPAQRRHSLLPTPPPSKMRRPRETHPSITSLGERDVLLTRIDELESMVMKLQHAVCVMDTRMQQFRMATSSWQPVIE